MDTSDITTKRCTKCRLDKPATTEYFHADKSVKCGLRRQCKICLLADAAAYRANNPEKVSASKKASVAKKPEYYQSAREQWFDMHPDKMAEYSDAYRKRNPQKAKARSAVNHAIRDGKLPHIDTCLCANCGNTAQAYHHPSYAPEHWLDVVPLCHKCHKGVHKS